MRLQDWRCRNVVRGVIGAACALVFACAQPAAAQSADADATALKTVKEKLKATGGKLEVTVEGIVNNHVDTPDSVKVKGFYLRDVKGDLILVRTTQKLPFPNTRVQVKGIAMIDREPPFKNTPFILEDERKVLNLDSEVETARGASTLTPTEQFRRPGDAETVPPVAGGATVTKAAPTTETTGGKAVNTEPVKSTTPAQTGPLAFLTNMSQGVIAAIALVGVALIVGAVVLLQSRRKPMATMTSAAFTNPYASAPPASTPDPVDMLRPAAAGAGGLNGHGATPPAVEDYKTVKAYKTTKVLPGRLVVLEGGRETDVIHLSDQNGRGEIEIGRDAPDVMGGIRVKDKTNTLSRRQGKLIFDAAKREFTYLNLVGDEGNATVFNGRALRQNEAVVLNSRDVLAMGNVELMFTAK